jgi:outer membrane protein assembly complex protein YaeT
VAGLAATGAPACRRAPAGAGTEVKALSFEGNRAFKDGALADVLATRESGWLPWARKRYFNQRTFDADLVRLKAFYADRGYPDAQVTGVDIDFNEKRTDVSIAIHVSEGDPVLIESIQFNGLSGFAAGMHDAVSGVIPIKEGQPRDRVEINASRDRALFELRDRGYPNAHIELTEAAGSAPQRVRLTFTVTPGQSATFGAVSLKEPLVNVSDKVIFRSLSFKPGDVYRESQVLQSQRRLASLGLFEFAHVGPVPTKEGEPPHTANIPMVVTVTPAKTTRTQVGIGFGSEDGIRGSFMWRNLNFLRDARQFTTDAKYSRRLKSATVDFVEPYLGHSEVSGALGVGGAIFDEDTYVSTSYGGRASVTWRPQVGRGLYLEPVDHVVRLAYRNESLEYEIKPETLDDITQFDDLIALGFDPTTGSGSGRVGSLDLDIERTMLDNPLNMTRGHLLRFHLEHAATWLGGTYRYTEILGEGRIYFPIGSMVLANRVRVGALLASAPDLIPFSSRYFLGGSTSLRGWGRFQVAPLTEDGLPIGGEKVLEMSTELRVPLRGSFGAVAFVDAGNVYSDNASISIEHLRVSVGPGIRWTSPVGIVRADLGIQLNPIPGLKLDGQPETRHWRIHFSIGHTF